MNLTNESFDLNKSNTNELLEHLISIVSKREFLNNNNPNNEIPFYESKLIDIKAENLYIHNIVLKSSKRDVKPLIIKIGNSLLADTINCFDQLNESSKITMKKISVFKNVPKKAKLRLINKFKFYNYKQ